MTKGGIPLQESTLKYGVSTGISETPAMTEYEAAVAAGLDVWRWEQTGKDGYPMWFKANILAWYRMRGLKETHSQDVVAVVQEKESKRRRNK